ncbi:MAG: hypothetical protein V1855_04895, partial [bacterium]
HAKMKPHSHAEKNVTATNWADFVTSYGASYDAFIQDVLDAKGMTELGGSSAGIGDVSLYTHVNFESSRFDKMMLGARCVIPSADKRSQSKLWAPELGNGGFFEVGVFGNVSLYKSKYFNPHVFAMASGSFTSHVDRRVPKKFTITGSDAGKGKGKLLNSDLGYSIAFGDRVTKKGDTDLEVVEAPFREIGDNILSVKMRRGEQFNVRVGNMVEKFIYRRAFFDMYYDLYVKFRDTFSGFKEDEWNIEPYRINSQQVAHSVGAEFSYQFDEGSRFRCGCDYVFAGSNTPKAFTVKANMNYSF